MAADIRGDWREAIQDGLSPEVATSRLMESWRDVREDSDDGPVFWIALAAAQVESGRLLNDVRDRALDVIANGADIARFAESSPKLAHERDRVLDRLAAKLRGPQRAPTRTRRPTPFRSPFAIGDVVRIGGKQGHRDGLFVVIGETEAYPPGSTQPVVATLSWAGGDLPSPGDLAHLPLLIDAHEWPGRDRTDVMLQAVLSPPRGRLALTNFGSVVAHGVMRRDAPVRRAWEGHASPMQLGYCSCEFLAGWVEGEWFDACLALTKRDAARPLSSVRSWWRRLRRRLP